MRVVQLSKADRGGGASIAAFRFHGGLRAEGIESFMLVNNKHTSDSHVVGPSSRMAKIWASAAPFLDTLPLRLFFRGRMQEKLSLNWVPDNIRSRLSMLKPDVVNIHWVNDGFVRIETFPRLGYPVVWTLHDMWAFCGAQHYVGDDQRYLTGYNAARTSRYSGWDANRWVWNRKRRAWSKLNRFVVVTPSVWLGNCVRASSLMRHLTVKVIPNGIDHQIFKPLDRKFARDVLGLPQDRKLVLFGAGGVADDPRKGFAYLVAALKSLASKSESKNNQNQIDLVIFGSPNRDIGLEGIFRTHFLGKLRDEISLALAYSAADVFVAPSQQDNLPNTVLESLACGTPVVAFNIGGMPDMILHDECGYLATPFDSSDLANGIQHVLELSGNASSNRLREAARIRVTRSFTLPIQAQSYVNLYQSLIDGAIV